MSVTLSYQLAVSAVGSNRLLYMVLEHHMYILDPDQQETVLLMVTGT